MESPLKKLLEEEAKKGLIDIKFCIESKVATPSALEGQVAAVLEAYQKGECSEFADY